MLACRFCFLVVLTRISTCIGFTSTYAPRSFHRFYSQSQIYSTLDEAATTDFEDFVAKSFEKENDWTTTSSVGGLLQAGILIGVSEEKDKVLEIAGGVCEEQFGVTLETSSMMAVESMEKATTFPGILGRVLVLLYEPGLEEQIEDLEVALAVEMDKYVLADEPTLSDPVLVVLRPSLEFDPQESNVFEYVNGVIKDVILENDLMNTVDTSSNGGVQHAAIPPTLQVEVDGAMVRDGKDERWDTSSIYVIDDMISEDLRTRLLNLVRGHDEEDWNDTTRGPHPTRWTRDALVDTPAQEEEQGCWGLPQEAIEELCAGSHQPIAEFESILASAFPQFHVGRLPPLVLGMDVSPLTANAPTHGDSFHYHIDGDPMVAPSSMWTDVYGRYQNRATGKPRFVSCLVYLNHAWNYDELGAPTRCLDVASGETLDIEPKPGRVVLMDQDITHTVVAPNENAGNQPRYSLVWKLVLFPKEEGQNMRKLFAKSDETLFLGSAKQQNDHP